MKKGVTVRACTLWSQPRSTPHNTQLAQMLVFKNECELIFARSMLLLSETILTCAFRNHTPKLSDWLIDHRPIGKLRRH